ncbi:MAG: hypothetical protein HYS23_06905, partial [Geobacter sp.]|nr:hypothetical protein [Geobacter sp.]
MYGDNTIPAYDSTTFKFTDKPLSQYLLYDYASSYTDTTFPTRLVLTAGQTNESLFQARVDNSMASVMRDCAECHVGGGGNEYIPNKRPDLRAELRNYTTTTVNTYSYYIDNYGPAGDGVGATFAPTKSDYRQTGVLEMDCLICHLKDYNYEGRKHAVRKGEFDASRTAGAGIGTPVDGKTVTYDPTKVVNDGSGNLKLASSVVANILPTPDTVNCVNCHMQERGVDWKKRGDQWTTDEVHYNIGCLGCHKRPDADFSRVGTSGFAGLKGTYGYNNISSAANAGYDANVLGQCDPAKGHAPYSALWNKNDGPYGNQAKGYDYACKGCHIDGGFWDGSTFRTINTMNAPNPTGTHDAAFLNAKLLQDATYSGTATKSHLDVITCSGCHTGKGNYSGGAMVDGTGADAEGRVADHENANVERNMLGKIVYEWQGGILIPANLNTSIFWRDKNDLNFDANNDGRAGGMDSLLQTHVASINQDFGMTALTQYAGGVTSGIIDTHIQNINNSLESKLKVTPGPTKAIKLSFMGVGFKSNHGIVPAGQARGAAGRGGCADCHGADKGYYNGTFRVIGDNIQQFEFRGNQITPFSMTNGSTQPTDFHVAMKDKSDVRALAVQFASYSSTSPNIHSVRNIDRSQTMYEDNFKKRDTSWKNLLPGSGINAAKYPDCTSASTATTQGWLLKVEVQEPGTTDPKATPIKTLTRQVMGCYSTANGMINDADGKGLSVLNNGTNNPYFTISTNGDDYNLKLTAKDKTLGNPYVIRLHPQSDAGYFGLGNQLWMGQTYTGVVKDAGGNPQTATDRGAWLTYMNSLGTDPDVKTRLGLGVTPTAAISGTIPADADSSTGSILELKQQSYDFIPTTGGNSTYVTYKWAFSDGVIQTSALPSGAVTRDFTTVPSGNYNVTLTVTGVDGKSASVTKGITVAQDYAT